MLEPIFRSNISAITKAAIDSQTTVPRIATHGSCLPFKEKSNSSLAVFIVCCVLNIDGVGLKYTFRTMSSPLEIPPKIPPA